MMWCLILLAIASCGMAQPVFGPYEITTAASSTQLGAPLTTIDSAGVLHIFYTERNGTMYHVFRAKYDARTGTEILGPLQVFSEFAQRVQLEDLKLNENGELVLLFSKTVDSNHQLVLLRPDDDVFPPVTLADTTDNMHSYWGGSSFEISGARLVAVAADYTQAAFLLTENNLTRLGDWGWCAVIYEWPTAVFVNSSDSVSSVTLSDSIPYSFTEGVFLTQPLTPRSFYVWVGNYESQERVLVDDSSFHSEATIPCEAGNLSGAIFSDDIRLHLREEHYYNNPNSRIYVTELLDDDCNQVASYACVGIVHRASAQPDYGFAFSSGNEVMIELYRLGNDGQLAASRGSIAWRQQNWHFTYSTTAIGNDGFVAVVWNEVLDSTGMQRMAFSSCEWTTPLDAPEHNTPVVPRELSLSSYPNPFNSTVTIQFELPTPSRVTLSVFDIQGRLVTTLRDDFTAAGSHTISWSPEQLSSGVYFARLEAGAIARSSKLLYLK